VHTQSLTVDQSLASLHTSARGLTQTEAQRRLAEFGRNHVEEVSPENLLLRFAREFTHFFAIILWLGAALAFLAEYFDPGQGMVRLASPSSASSSSMASSPSGRNTRPSVRSRRCVSYCRSR